MTCKMSTPIYIKHVKRMHKNYISLEMVKRLLPQAFILEILVLFQDLLHQLFIHP
jgi:hypothetical protein